jgi:glycosyltransferase involved in cell wall biosynthesis
MKIIIVAESFIGYLSEQTTGSIYGGQELLLYRTCKILINAGHNVEVIQFGNENKIFFYENIKIIQVKERKFRFLEKIGFIRRWTWASFFLNPKIPKDADWIHFHNHHFSFPHSLWLRGKKTGMNHGVEWDVPWVYENLTIRNLKQRFSFLLLKIVTRFSVNNLDKILTNDLFFIHFTTLRKPHLQYKFDYIPNFVDNKIFNPEILPHELIKGSFATKKILLLPKMAMKERGTDIMIEVMNRIKDKGFVLIITGTSSGIDYWKNLVKQKGLSDIIIFTGHIDYNKELPSIYSASKYVIIPSPCREATAISMLEAMAMKKPLILSNIGGLPEIGKDRYNCLLRNANPDAICEAIMELENNPELAKEIANNAFDFVNKANNTSLWDLKILNFFKA